MNSLQWRLGRNIYLYSPISIQTYDFNNTPNSTNPNNGLQDATREGKDIGFGGMGTWIGGVENIIKMALIEEVLS